MDVKEKTDENGSPMLVVTTDKANVEYYVKKTNDGFVFYYISSSSGKIPDSLKGVYTRMAAAKEELNKYIHNMSKSKTKQRDDRWSNRVASKSKPTGEEPVQQGSSN